MESQNIKLICCVISSHDSIYDAYKEQWIRYLRCLNKLKNICFYFIYNDNEISSVNVNQHDNYTDIYFPFEENVYPGILRKTLGFYDYLYKTNIKYTHLLRTNLSSFFKFDELIKLLKTQDIENLVMGNCVEDKFPSGCGTVFSYDVIQRIIECYSKNNHIADLMEYDDVIIGTILCHLGIPVNNYEYVNFCEKSDDEVNKLINIPHFHYRTKPFPNQTSMLGVNWFTKLIDHYIKKPPLIIDCFIFYNEINLLNYRLNILEDYVDYFILVEASRTFTGHKKPLYFQQNLKDIKNSNKIIYVPLEDMPVPHEEFKSPDDAWINEKFQRNCITRGLNQLQLSSHDIIILSDVDEIPNPNLLHYLKSNSLQISICKLEQDMYYYNLNTKLIDKWYHPKIMSYEYFSNSTNTLHDIRHIYNCDIIENGGWHLSYFGDVLFIINKIKNFSHQELNNETFTNDEHILDAITNNKDCFDRSDIKMKFIHHSLNDNLPPEWFNYLKKFTIS